MIQLPDVCLLLQKNLYARPFKIDQSGHTVQYVCVCVRVCEGVRGLICTNLHSLPHASCFSILVYSKEV